MKASLCFGLFLLLTDSIHSQGTLVFQYDQQSATENIGGGTATIQAYQPMGQSFTPALSQVGFIRLRMYDPTQNGIGSTVVVNLRSDSITGAVLATSLPLALVDRFSGYGNFIFSAPVDVTPETKYFFQPEVIAGDQTLGVDIYHYSYSRGNAYLQGNQISFQFWFREGIIVPEPSSSILAVLGIGCFLWQRRLRL